MFIKTIDFAIRLPYNSGLLRILVQWTTGHTEQLGMHGGVS